MFDDRLEAALGAPGALLELAVDTQVEERWAGCRKLVLAAAWADARSALSSPVDDAERVDRDRLVEVWPRGCPKIVESAAAELAVAWQTSVGGARSWIGDAVNLRHRLPRIWARVVAGEVLAWKARQVARSTSHLSELHAREVDRLLAPHLELLAWRRFVNLLDATLLHVDEKTYRARADERTNHRDVWATDSSAGCRSLIARCDAGDVTAVLALINRIADLLADEGDDDPVATRRAKAIGIVAYPDRALDLLLRHATQPEDQQPWWDRDPVQDSDPWAETTPAGRQNAEYGKYHQPNPDDPDYTDSQQPPAPDERPAPADEPDPADVVWLHAQENDTSADAADTGESGTRRRFSNTGGIHLGNALAAFRDLTPDDLARARPRVVIHLHLTDQAVTSGRGVIRTAHGPITADQLRRFLGDTGAATITVQPVLDPAAVAPTDAYEIPPRMRRAVTTKQPGSVFPFSPATDLTDRLDLDHTIRYRELGPPGQTRPDNLGPLARNEHRAKTHAGFSTRQPEPGIHVWRTPHGLISLVTNQGTLLLGTGPYAQQIGSVR